MKDGAFWYRGGDDSNGGEDLRGREFLDRDFLVQDKGFEQGVLKGWEGGPVFFIKLLAAKGFLGKFKEGVGDWGVGWGSVALLSCEEGVVDVVQGGTREDEVGGVWWGEEGDVGVGVLDRLVGGGSVLFVKSIEFRLRGSGGSGGRH